MTNVNGEIFQSKDTKSFKADAGKANKETNRLSLSGNVFVESEKEGSTLECDKLVYDANEKVFEAKGNVTVTNKAMKITGVPAVVANSDFSEISSPDLYRGQNETKKH
jgi:LPS export ABC transporter protein LptC